MPFNMDTKYKFVDTPEGPDRVVRVLEDLDVMAVDLEADSMYHFQDKVCLIQLAVGHQIFIVDPIKLESIEPLK